MKFPEKQSGSIKNLIKLKAGESVVGVFRGEPSVIWKHWENNRGFVCSGVACDRCKIKKASYRIQINFVVKENGVFVAKVFEQGHRFQAQLEELNKEYPLENHVVKISRTGNGQSDTSYSIVPIKNSLLSKEAEALIEMAGLNPLGPEAIAGATQAKEATDGPEDDSNFGV